MACTITSLVISRRSTTERTSTKGMALSNGKKLTGVVTESVPRNPCAERVRAAASSFGLRRSAWPGLLPWRCGRDVRAVRSSNHHRPPPTPPSRGAVTAPRAAGRLLCVVPRAAQLLHHHIHVLLLCATADLIGERAVKFPHAPATGARVGAEADKDVAAPVVRVHGRGAPRPRLPSP